MSQMTISQATPETIGHDDPGPDIDTDTSRGPASRARTLLDPSSPAMTYTGVVVTIVGFILVLVAWSKVAGQTNVALQTPYLVSAGFTGLGLIMTGLLVINIGAKRREAAARARQTAQLAEALRNLQQTLDR